MQNMKVANLKLPPITSREVWIGSYGGHYDAIVIFHTKPIKSKDGWNSVTQRSCSMVDLLANKKCIAACMWCCDFEELYPSAKIPAPKEIEVTTLYKRIIEGFWTDDDRLLFPTFDADGW
jgi:hypothetical protein